MKSGGGKAKGSAFERDVCKKLSLWVTKNKRDDVFWRSAMSGGRATVAGKKGQGLAHVSGDICATHADGYALIEEIFIECKFYRDLTFAALVTSNSGLIERFWDKAQSQAHQHGKTPVVILKQNQMPALVGMTAVGVELFDLSTRVQPIASFPNLGLELYTFEEFLHHAAPLSQKPASVRPTLNLKRKG